MLLKELLQTQDAKSAQSGIYIVKENDEVIYVGIGGQSSRPFLGRLREHANYSKMFSSLRAGFMIHYCWKELGMSYDDALARFEALDWSMIVCDSVDQMLAEEERLIKKYMPRFNDDKK